MVELIHTSDWHLGNPFSAFAPAQQQRLSEARFEAVTRLLSRARERGVHLVLCAGDQVDNGELRSTAILLRLFGIISAYPEIQIVMIAGNHDPFTPSSVYARVDPASYPKNLLFVDRPRVVDLPDHGVRILAAPLTERFGRTNPIEELCREEAARPAPEGTVLVGLAHGSAAVSETVGGESDAFPIPPQLAKEAGLDYLALGDWHSYLALGERTCYPGTHEPLAFGDEAGSLQVRIAERGARPTVERIGADGYHWIEIERTLGDESLEGLLAELQEGTHTLDTPAPGDEARSSSGTAGRARVPRMKPGELDFGEGRSGPGAVAGGPEWSSGSAGRLAGGPAPAGETLLRLRLGGYVSFDRFKRLEEALAIARERYLAVFVERLPEIRPSGVELREIAAEGYMQRVVERLLELETGEGGEAAAAESALLRVYAFFHTAAETTGGAAVPRGGASAGRARAGRSQEGGS